MNFGKPPIHPTDLASALAQQIGQTFDCPTNQAGFERLQRRKFTLTLQQTLQDLGEKRHMKVMYQKKGLPRDKTLRPQEKQHDKAEFLFDHVWFDSEDRICLAAEFELSRYGDHAIDDFRKLLYVKAPLKVCVFSDHKLRSRGKHGKARTKTKSH